MQHVSFLLQDHMFDIHSPLANPPAVTLFGDGHLSSAVTTQNIHFNDISSRKTENVQLNQGNIAVLLISVNMLSKNNY